MIYRYVSGGLLFLLILTGIAFKLEQRHSHKLQGQVVKLKGELDRISSEKNRQQVITRERIVEIERKSGEADKRARVVEAAPLPGQCRTPDAVMGADL